MSGFNPSRRMLLQGIGAGLATTSMPSALSALQMSADMVIRNAKICTQMPNQPWASAMAVKGGRILAVGRSEDMAQFEIGATQVIDAGGRTIIPGLNDSHLHAIRGGRFYAAELRWDGVQSLEAALNMVREAAKRVPKGGWVRVQGGWSEHQFVEKRLPTPEELTAAAPDTPVLVVLLYSQGFLNKAAIKAIGLTPESPFSAGTRYEVGADGELTGRIMAEPYPNLLYGTIGRLPPLSVEEQVSSSIHWYRELNRFGLTSAVDAGGGGHRFPSDYAGSAALAASGDLPIRLSYYLFPQRPGKELDDFKTWTGSHSQNSNAAKIMNGYVIEGGGELLVYKASDYENFLAPRPDFTQNPGWDRELRAVVGHLVRKGWPFRIHATYNESINAMMDVFETIHAEEVAGGRPGLTGIRWAFDHAETITPETIARVKALGGAIAIQARMAYAGEAFLERYGRKAAADAPPLRKMLQAGIPVGAGSDGTRVASYHPWSALYWMTTGRTVGGTLISSEENRLSRAEALNLYTLGSAYFSGEEGVKGRLAPGQFADFAILSDDYFAVGEEAIRKIESVLTVTDGKIVYGAGDFSDLSPALPELKPDWSPVHQFGGYQNRR